MEGIQLPTALALLLRADMVGVRPRPRKRRHDILFALDLAANVAHEPVQPRAQDVQLPFVALELLGMSVASRHHRRALGEAQVGLPRRAGQSAQRCYRLLCRRRRIFILLSALRRRGEASPS
jgi:hypothetical protein